MKKVILLIFFLIFIISCSTPATKEEIINQLNLVNPEKDYYLGYGIAKNDVGEDENFFCMHLSNEIIETSNFVAVTWDYNRIPKSAYCVLNYTRANNINHCICNLANLAESDKPLYAECEDKFIDPDFYNHILFKDLKQKALTQIQSWEGEFSLRGSCFKSELNHEEISICFKEDKTSFLYKKGGFSEQWGISSTNFCDKKYKNIFFPF